MTNSYLIKVIILFLRPMKMLFVFILLCSISCAPTKQVLNEDKPVDYSDPKNWASLPTKKDNADLSPDGKAPVEDGGVDIFFLYPTSMLAHRDRPLWNAAIDNQKINNITDRSSIKYQASIFNQVGRIYAPRYRQAHYDSYFSKDTARAFQAFNLAYNDVRDAFLYYLKHFNQDRPIIIAGHSQGTTHGMKLVKEFFDGTPLQSKLVVAYLPGIPIPIHYFHNLPVCTSADDLTCINTWRTYKFDHTPKYLAKENPVMVVNPLSWKTDYTYYDKMHSKGAVFQKFENGIKPQRVDAQIHGNLLWVHKPVFPNSFLFLSNNFHIADFNFFYLDVRENAIHRRDLYLKK